MKLLEYLIKGFFALIVILLALSLLTFLLFMIVFPIYAFVEINVFIGIVSSLICWSSFLGLIVYIQEN